MPEKLIVFDTTLRDGEQAPGASLNTKEKIEIARQLEALGVDIIEAGFPISSKGDFEAVRSVAKAIKRTTVCGLARATKADIDVAYNAVKYAKHRCIHVFLATSKIHMKYKLKKAEDEIVRLAAHFVRYAKKYCNHIEFSPEDASRTEPEFLFRVVEKVIDAGATVVNIPDTVGYAEPEEFGNLIADIKENVSNIDDAIISVHCHNDLGLAVANSLAAVKNGARQVECTINGIGERAGNASMEEIVMAVKTRSDQFSVSTSIKTPLIHKTSRLVSKLTGFVVAPNKAIVGRNAFRHEAGIHQDGILKKRQTYEIIRPEDVGFSGEGLILGKHSGSHAFKKHLGDLGFHLNEKEFSKAFKMFKQLADKKKDIFDEDIIAIAEEQIAGVPEVWKLVGFAVTSGSDIAPKAAVKLKFKNKLFNAVSSGDGPVDACYKAVDKITKIKPKLLNYSLQALTKGKDAQGEVSLGMKFKGENLLARGSSTDIVEASIKAYLNGITKISYKKKSRNTTKSYL